MVLVTAFRNRKILISILILILVLVSISIFDILIRCRNPLTKTTNKNERFIHFLGSTKWLSRPCLNSYDRKPNPLVLPERSGSVIHFASSQLDTHMKEIQNSNYDWLIESTWLTSQQPIIVLIYTKLEPKIESLFISFRKEVVKNILLTLQRRKSSADHGTPNILLTSFFYLRLQRGELLLVSAPFFLCSSSSSFY